LAGNLFFLKGWTITLITALFALSSKDPASNEALVAYLLVIVFWVLDAYFLSQERQFRALYDDVAQRDEISIDFSMKTGKYRNIGKNNLPHAMFSGTILWFYGSLFAILIIIKATN